MPELPGQEGRNEAGMKSLRDDLKALLISCSGKRENEALRSGTGSILKARMNTYLGSIHKRQKNTIVVFISLKNPVSLLAL